MKPFVYTPPSYGMSLVIWNHSVLPATWHRWTCPAYPSQKGW